MTSKVLFALAGIGLLATGSYGTSTVAVLALVVELSTSGMYAKFRYGRMPDKDSFALVIPAAAVAGAALLLGAVTTSVGWLTAWWPALAVAGAAWALAQVVWWSTIDWRPRYSCAPTALEEVLGSIISGLLEVGGMLLFCVFVLVAACVEKGKSSERVQP